MKTRTMYWWRAAQRGRTHDLRVDERVIGVQHVDAGMECVLLHTLVYDVLMPDGTTQRMAKSTSGMWYCVTFPCFDTPDAAEADFKRWIKACHDARIDRYKRAAAKIAEVLAVLEAK